MSNAAVATSKPSLGEKLNLDGVKNLVNYMLFKAFRDYKADEYPLLKYWLDSEECEFACYCAQVDYNYYKKTQTEAFYRWKETRSLKPKIEREFWYGFEVSKFGQKTFGSFALPEVKKLDPKPVNPEPVK